MRGSGQVDRVLVLTGVLEWMEVVDLVLPRGQGCSITVMGATPRCR